MSIAALYDIHANLPALEAVLDDVRNAGIGHVVIGGDVLPGPMPRECLALLRSLDMKTSCIRGNGDRVVLAARRGADISEVPEAFRPAMQWNADQLDAASADWVSSWPATQQLSVAGLGEVLFCHATPDSDTYIFTRTTPAEHLTPLFAKVNVAVVVCGHTHMQFDRKVGGTRVVNAGSVGMSFQGPGAYWLEIGADQARLRRTAYDLTAAAERVRRTAFPQAAEFAIRNIMQPPSEDAMLEVFNQQAG